MKYWIYALVIIYIIWPFDIFPDVFIGGGWLDDLFILSILGWYHFVYRKRHRTKRNPYGADDGYAGGRNGEAREGPGARFGGNGRGGEETRRKDPYEILGIKRNASSEEIKQAYRLLVNQYHPDKVVHLGEEFRILAEKKFKEIQQAYQELQPNK